MRFVSFSSFFSLFSPLPFSPCLIFRPFENSFENRLLFRRSFDVFLFFTLDLWRDFSYASSILACEARKKKKKEKRTSNLLLDDKLKRRECFETRRRRPKGWWDRQRARRKGARGRESPWRYYGAGSFRRESIWQIGQNFSSDREEEEDGKAEGGGGGWEQETV